MSSRLAKPLRNTIEGLHKQIDRFGGGNERTAGFMRLFIFNLYQWRTSSIERETGRVMSCWAAPAISQLTR